MHQNQLIQEYLDRGSWQISENSNMGYSLQGLNNYLASHASKQYWLSEVYPAHIARCHEQGDLHIHDLGSLSVYCVGWDLLDLLQEGFTGVAGKVASHPPK